MTAADRDAQNEKLKSSIIKYDKNGGLLLDSLYKPASVTIFIVLTIGYETLCFVYFKEATIQYCDVRNTEMERTVTSRGPKTDVKVLNI